MTFPDFIHDPEYDGTPLCAEADPESWFPDLGGSATEAKRICRRCELRDPCLEYAIRHDVKGVWGGESEQRRKRIRKARGIHAEPLLIPVAEERRDVTLRMAKRGTPVADIARHLGITEEAVYRILRAAA